jgi:cation diffusion facilitator family transporter
MSNDSGKGAARAKRLIALSSVAAGIGLTLFKVAIGLTTGSLGILAEAAHSGLDLVAALMTFLAVRLADRPPDPSHPYGHGKVENLSAFLEAVLLLLTAAWVGFEAVQRLVVHEIHVQASVWAFLVMGVSIVVDVSRSRALRRAADRYGSQALKADALHFSTDIWSSAVVILGLAAIKIGDVTGWPGPWEQADAIAALGVCAVVVFVGGRLVKETIDALLDRAPEALAVQIVDAVVGVPAVLGCDSPRLRRVGNKLFADMVVRIPRTATFQQAHAITESIERAVREALPQVELDLMLHMEPAKSPRETADDTIRHLAREVGLRVHDVHVTRAAQADSPAGEELEADVHVEVDPALTLDVTHALADRLERAVRRAVPSMRAVNTHLEVLTPPLQQRAEVTNCEPELVARVREITEAMAGPDSCHEVRIYHPLSPDNAEGAARDAEEHDLVIHLTMQGDMGIPQVHERSEDIERALRDAIPGLARVLIHAEPPE